MKEIITQRIQSLTPEYRKFITSDYIPNVVHVFAEAENLSVEDKNLLQMSVTLFALFFLSKEELIESVATDIGMPKDDSTILIESVLQAFPTEYIALQNALYEYFEADIFTDKRLEKIADARNINEPSKQILFANIVEAVTGGKQTRGAIPQLLIDQLEIDQATAMRITADVLDFLEPLDTTKTAVPVVTNIPIQTPTAVVAPEPISLADELAAAEATFHQLQPIRTMAGDMQTLKHDVPTHQAASQETLLNGDGNGKKNPGAQWGEQ